MCTNFVVVAVVAAHSVVTPLGHSRVKSLTTGRSCSGLETKKILMRPALFTARKQS